MYQSVCELLETYEYEYITWNVVGVSLGLKCVGEQGYAVVTLDETTGNLLTREQFENISRQIRGFIEKRGCLHTRFLYLLISQEEESRERLFRQGDNYWWIIPTKGRIMVFEKSVPEFLELRRPLEKMFPIGGVLERNDGKRGRAFQGFLKNRRLPKCNLLIVALNIIIFLITDLFLFLIRGDLLEWGALGWHEVLEEGQWYRLFTSLFMHGGIDHIFSNMFVLLYLGGYLEQQIGSVRYCIIYFGAGLLAGFTSMGYNMILGDYTVSMGASGAVFGVMGALLCLVIFFRDWVREFHFRQIAVMIFFGLYGGFVGQGVDNAAHVGGMVAGFLLTVIVMLPGGEKKYR